MSQFDLPARRVPLEDGWDVIVVGGGPAGCAAAAAAAAAAARGSCDVHAVETALLRRHLQGHGAYLPAE